MSSKIAAGNNSIILQFTHPVEDDGVTLRDDLMGVKVWYSKSATFNPANNEGTLAYDGQNLDVTIPDLDGDVSYYVKYAYISEIEPSNYVIQSAGTVKPLEGSNAQLARSVDVVPAKSDGTGYSLPDTNEIFLYRGGGILTVGVTYGPATQTKNGLTATVDPQEGTVTFSGTSWSTDTETFTFTATVGSKVFSVDYNITKSKAGSEAVFIDLLRESELITSSYDGSEYEYPIDTNYVRLYKGGELVTSGVVYGPSMPVFQHGLELVVNSTTGAISLDNAPAQTWTSDREMFTVTAQYGGKTYSASYLVTKNKSGEAAVNPDLTSESDVVSAKNDGTGYTLPTGIVFSLLKGGTAVPTASIAFKITNTASQTQTKNGLTASIDSSGQITLSGTSWTTDSEQFSFSATYQNHEYIAIYSISKSRAGTDAVLMDLLRDSDVISSNNDGSGYTLPAVNSIRIYKGGQLQTTGVSYGPPSQQNNGLTASVDSSGQITLSGASWSSNTEIFTFTANFEGKSYSKSYSISKSKTGAVGQQGNAAKSVDITGITNFSLSVAGAFSPASATLTAVTQNIVAPTFAWTVTNAGTNSTSNAAITITPSNPSITNIGVQLVVTEPSTGQTFTRNITLAVAYAGQPGQAGQGGFQSAFPTIYKWSPTEPSRPSTTSTYTWASGSYSAPSGWFTYAPSDTTPENILWAITVPVNAQAPTTTSTLDWTNATYPITARSYNGATGQTGASGSGTYVITRTTGTQSPTNAEVSAVTGRNPVNGDVVTVTATGTGTSQVYKYIGGTWAVQTTYITGSLIVENTITGDKLVANTITADKIDTRGLSIKDSGGNVIFAAGTALSWNYISNSFPSSIDNSFITAAGIGAVKTDLSNAPAGILNSNVSLNSLGAGALAFLNKINSATYIEAAVIKSALVNELLVGTSIQSVYGNFVINMGTSPYISISV